VWLIGRSLAINDTGFGTGFALNSNGLAFEVDVTIAVARVGAGSNEDGVAIDGVVDPGLDRAEVGGTVVIDVDDSAPGMRVQQGR
jgi:hypothetical protein